MNNLKIIRDKIGNLVPIIILIVLWQIWVEKSGSNIIPAPTDVFHESLNLLVNPGYYTSVAITLSRIFVSLSLAILISLLICYLIHLKKEIQNLLELPLRLLSVIPQSVIVFVIIILLKVTHQTTIILAILLCVIPNIYLILGNGITALDQRYYKISKVYRLNRYSEFKNIILPGISPYLVTAIHVGLSLAWRSTMLVELFSFSGGVGYQIYYQFQLFSLTGVLAWSITFTGFMILIDSTTKYLLKSWLTHDK